MQQGRIHNIKCPRCGKYQSIKVFSPVPRISFWRCDLCGGSIPLEYDEKTDKFQLPKNEFRGSEVGELNVKEVLLFGEN